MHSHGGPWERAVITSFARSVRRNNTFFGKVLDSAIQTLDCFVEAGVECSHERRFNMPAPEGRRLEKGVTTMAVYVMLTTLTDEGRKTVKEKPDRIKEVNKEVEAKGVKIIAQYALLGQYDFVNILEAPDNETITRVAVELGSRGTLQTTTLSAMSLDDFIATLKK